MPINQVEFIELEKHVSKKAKPALQLLAPELGKVYIIAITRDNCPACKRQKPKLDKLAKDMEEKHGNNAVFTSIHVKQLHGDTSESQRAKTMLNHYFYPTNLILIKTKDRGTIEYYRNASPTMSELGRNIENALETATMLAKETN
jgi:thiol-disulfide isomerase/thioredoxin